jgi:hypothetical protein
MQNLKSDVFRFALAAFAAMLASSALNASPQRSEPIWSGNSAGFAIQWTTDDLAARPAAASAPSFSLRQLARKDFADIEKDSQDDGHCEYSRSFKLLSVVGSIVSYEDDYFLSCENTAHPSGRARFVAVDLSKSTAPRRTPPDASYLPAQVASLTDYFASGEILKALMADALVRKALQGQAAPRTLNDLLAYLKENFPSVADDEKQCFELDPDLLTRFSFHHIEGNRIAVRLGLSGPEVCRDNLTQIGLLLPIPPSLKDALAKADSGSEGFLMNKKIGGARTTTANFETRKRRK